jgi:hypothetical protein
MGSSEIKGTYFHPLIFTFILKSACPAFEHILSADSAIEPGYKSISNSEARDRLIGIGLNSLESAII